LPRLLACVQLCIAGGSGWLALGSDTGLANGTRLLGWIVLAGLGLALASLVASGIRRQLHRAGAFSYRLALLDGAASQDVTTALRSGPVGCEIVGMEGACGLEGLRELIDRRALEAIVVARGTPVHRIRELSELPADLWMVDGKASPLSRRWPLVLLARNPLDERRRLIKATEDRLLAAAILVLTAPLLLLIAGAVKLSSPGPVFFRQARYGLNRRPFEILKFRTMYVGACGCCEGELRQACRQDSRVTPLGRWLRRTSLDELPQVINVLRGEMSIVGPRPHATVHDEHYEKLIPGYGARQRMKPGITGWAQVHGLRGETETLDKMAARVRFDRDYIERWSPGLDLSIILRTVLVGFHDPNAY
jgi:exopolysaccharide biosynthesis polyprenyl glycosylphosphotransferase